MDPSTFTVATLRIVARSFGLLTTGNKAEVIRRLQEHDPSDQWMQQAKLVQKDDATHHNQTDGTLHQNRNENAEQHDPNVRLDNPREEQILNHEIVQRDREIDLLRRERNLIQRELEIAKGRFRIDTQFYSR